VDIERLRPVILIEVETKVAFADVVGVEDGKVELKEVVECSRTPKATVASPAKPCWRARFRRDRCQIPLDVWSDFVEIFVASAPHECATCSSRRASRCRRSALLTNLTR
jgi:hypothetical protein